MAFWSLYISAFHSVQNGSTFKRYAKNIFCISNSFVFTWCFAEDGQTKGSTPRAWAMTLCCRRYSSLMHRHAISFETVQGRPVTMVESFHQRVGFSFSDGSWTWKRTLSACESKHRAWIQRELPKDTTVAPFGQGLSPRREPAPSMECWQGDGLDDLRALFISDVCFYNSQSWWPRRSEGISKQNVQSLTERWQMTFNLEKCNLVYLGKNNLKQRYSMVKGNLTRSKSKRNVRVIIADYIWVTKSFQNCLRTSDDTHADVPPQRRQGRRIHPSPARAYQSMLHANLNGFPHAHCYSANS